MSSKTISQGNTIEQRIFRIKQDYDYYIYGGQANYIESTSSTSSLELDWSAGSLHYGYFEVYTNNEHCVIQKQRDELDFGPDKGIDYDGILEELDLRFYTETEQIKQPPNSLNLGDLDDDDYDRLLVIQTEIDSDGFPLLCSPSIGYVIETAWNVSPLLWNLVLNEVIKLIRAMPTVRIVPYADDWQSSPGAQTSMTASSAHKAQWMQ